MNEVLLREGVVSCPGGVLQRVSFAYRYVVGYSGNPESGVESPSFSLVAASSRSSHTIFESAKFSARPYHWDRGEGGHPRNYSPPQHVDVATAIPLDDPVQLKLVFRNAGRNIHLQGAVGEGCDLGLYVEVSTSRGLNAQSTNDAPAQVTWNDDSADGRGTSWHFRCTAWHFPGNVERR